MLASVHPASAPALLNQPSSSGQGSGDRHSLERIFWREEILDFETEREKAQAMPSAFGSLALQLASDNANHQARNRNLEGGACSQRVTALMAALLPTRA
jgi:hypothetical protein